MKTKNPEYISMDGMVAFLRKEAEEYKDKTAVLWRGAYTIAANMCWAGRSNRKRTIKSLRKLAESCKGMSSSVVYRDTANALENPRYIWRSDEDRN